MRTIAAAATLTLFLVPVLAVACVAVVAVPPAACTSGGGGAAAGVPDYAPPGLVAAAVDTATRHSVDAAVFLVLIDHESRWNPDARSPVGAMGLTQLMPATAAALDVTDPWDPSQNLDGGARALKGRVDAKAGDYRAALAGYNGGTNPPASSWRYADSILSEATGITVTGGAVVCGPAAAGDAQTVADGPPLPRSSMIEVHGILVHPSIAGMVDAMIRAAAGEGVTLTGAGWRDTVRQAQLYNAHCRGGVCNPPTARPGSSMHERGVAVDWRLGPGVADWLETHDGEHGLWLCTCGEAWHTSVNGH
jgi:hypothetical protein